MTMEIGSRSACAVKHEREPQLRRIGYESNGCVILAVDETVFDLHGRTGIWSEARHASCRRRAKPGTCGKPEGVSQTYTGDAVIGMYAARTHREGNTVRGYTGSGSAREPKSEVRSRPPLPIGRRTDAHYELLHPRRQRSYRRIRWGTAEMPRESGREMRRVNESKNTEAARKMGVSMRFPRLSAPRRVVLASLAVLVLMLGAVSTSFAASQYRYEVQEGDTLDSVAATFGVDPQAIAASSYMPNGDSLTPGQVIVIPEPGQGPSDAAAMAAQLEGTSPWAYTSYTVQSGETLDSIAAAYGLETQALADFNGITDVTNISVGQRLVIPPSRDGQQAQASAQQATSTHAADVTVPGVPTYAQSRNLSCEYAAVHIATATFGNAIPEDVLINSIPVTKNPHNGYRGNIDGWWGNTDDYGIYPEALAPVVHDYGFSTDIFYGQGDTTQLKAELDAGHPVLVWLGLWGDTRERLSDDGNYSVATGMHVVVAYGYDSDGIYVSDPAHGNYNFYSWDAFVGMWNVLDGMSMAVYPN